MWFWRPKSQRERDGDPVPIPVVTRQVDAVSEPPVPPSADPPPADPPPPGVMRATGRTPGMPGLRGVPITSGKGRAVPNGATAALRPTRLSREVRRLLETLGGTRGDVAATLAAAGVRAAPRVGRCTPVSLYLCAVIGADPNVKSVRVNERNVTVELRAWWRSAVTVDLPFVVREFMIAFDQGCYPGLLASSDGRASNQG